MKLRRSTAVSVLILTALGSVLRGEVRSEAFGKTADGAAVELYTITNKTGASAKVMTLGASIVSIVVPDRAGKLDDVVLGYDTFDGYLKRNPCFGAVVGRYGNRIAGGAVRAGRRRVQA